MTCDTATLMIQNNPFQRWRRYIASCCALVLAVAAAASTLVFSLRNSWTQVPALATVALYVLASLLFELAASGRWFPQFSAPKTTFRGLLRGLTGILGLALLLSAVGFCFAMGPGKWKWTTVGFIFGMCGTSLLLIRSSITGTWF